MTSWSKDDLAAIASSDDLYVRAYNGQASRWYQAALQKRAGRIRVAGMTQDVSF